jgi:hypothetical protein
VKVLLAIAALVALLMLAANNPAPQPAQAPPTTISGTAPHCGFGPNDNDVRGVVRAVSPTTQPGC